MQVLAAGSVELPLPPGLGEVQAGAEAELADHEFLPPVPALRQAVAGEEDVAAFQPAIRLAIKMIAKGGGIGHIAVAPFERLRRACANLIGVHVCHGKSR
ncbi:hypothetical protein GCM10008012_07520 [Rhizobium anhuiense]|nr:hypothetical protein GCM10008012_07520 [Rhizobium anhuiense]